MASAADSRGHGREQGSGKPVDAAGSRGRGSGAKASTRPWRAPPRLSEEQRAKLPELLEQGAEAHGFRGEVWTCERVAIAIRREFGVSYHPAHVSRLLKALRQSLQKPQRRANQREKQAIERWKEQRWPSLKKGPEGGQDHSVRRSVRILPVAHGSSHVRTGRKDADPP